MALQFGASFAKALASNGFVCSLISLFYLQDSEAREEGVEMMRRWLSSDREFTDLELMKAWKALFFCTTSFLNEFRLFLILGMWHSDKPRVQQALAQTLSETLHDVGMKSRVDYMSAFWATMNREWAKIDRHRIDKFMWLVRYFVHEMLADVAQLNWDEEYLEEIIDVFSAFPLGEKVNIVFS